MLAVFARPVHSCCRRLRTTAKTSVVDHLKLGMLWHTGPCLIAMIGSELVGTGGGVGVGGAGLNADPLYVVAQNALLSVCGTIGGECCGNTCTQDNVDRPILPVSGCA